ncbi:MAG: heavy metal-associated domain-containing protein [Desulfobulbaceae bacterium]|nr:heavy metal-associated domain-containing protein [Desulfobulbaceae bacterium]
MPSIMISGMSCQHCVASVTKALSEIKGVTNVSVDLDKKEATYSESSPVSHELIKEAIAKIGFEVVG